LLEGSISDTTSADIMTSTQSSALSVADYGVTDHMFPDKSVFVSYKPITRF
jgi:hypothetical protein